MENKKEKIVGFELFILLFVAPVPDVNFCFPGSPLDAPIFISPLLTMAPSILLDENEPITSETSDRDLEKHTNTHLKFPL